MPTHQYNITAMDDGEIEDILFHAQYAGGVSRLTLVNQPEDFSQHLLIEWKESSGAVDFHKWVINNAVKYWELSPEEAEQEYKNFSPTSTLLN